MTVQSVDTEPIYYDPYDYGIDTDPHPVWRRMREEQLDNPVDYQMMIFMDPPEHDSLRKIVSRAFTPRRMTALEDSIGALVAQYLDPFTGTAGFDYISEFGALLPPMVIGELLGVPQADRDAIRLLVDEMLHIEDGATGPGEKAAQAGAEIYQYYAAAVAERRTAPRDDLISALLEAELDDDETRRKLTEEEIMAFVMLLNGAGVETVARLLSWAAVTLARNPRQREELVGDPSLMPARSRNCSGTRRRRRSTAGG